jgi:hypothetical protein
MGDVISNAGIHVIITISFTENFRIQNWPHLTISLKEEKYSPLILICRLASITRRTLLLRAAEAPISSHPQRDRRWPFYNPFINLSRDRRYPTNRLIITISTLSSHFLKVVVGNQQYRR